MLALDLAQNQERYDHDCGRNNQGGKRRVEHRCNQEANSRRAGCDESVRQLSTDVVKVIASACSSGQQRGIGDGGAVIAEQSAGHHSSDSDVNVDFELHGDGDCQRQENAECAVGGTGCKRNDTTYHKHKERKQGGSQEAASYINDELSGAQRTADVAQAESSNQNDGHIGHLR